MNSVNPETGIPNQASSLDEEGVESRLGEMKEDSPAKVARKALLGAVIGDGHLAIRGHKAHFVMAHSNKQFDYLIWKAYKLVPLVGKFQIDERKNAISGRVLETYRTKLTTLASDYLRHVYDDFYFFRDGKVRKELHLNVLNRLTPISLAVWYGDDGFLTPDGQAGFSTNGFTRGECETIKAWLKQSLNLDSRLDRQGNTFSLRMPAGDSRLFVEEIAKPYLWEVECMRYKMDNTYPKPSNQSARHPFWDDEILRTPRNYQRGEGAVTSSPYATA